MVVLSAMGGIENLPQREILVGAPGVEPGTSCTPCKRASRTAPRPVAMSGDIIVVVGDSGNTALKAEFLLATALLFLEAACILVGVSRKGCSPTPRS